MCGRFHKGHVSSGDQPSAAVVGMSLAYPMMNSALWSPRRGDEAKATRSSSPAARPRRSDLEQRSDHSLPPDGSRLDTHAGRCHMNASDFDAVTLDARPMWYPPCMPRRYLFPPININRLITGPVPFVGIEPPREALICLPALFRLFSIEARRPRSERHWLLASLLCRMGASILSCGALRRGLDQFPERSPGRPLSLGVGRWWFR
jgi:hypothetical protein